MLKYTTLRIFYIEDIIFCPFMDSFGAVATPNNYHTRTSEKLNRGKGPQLLPLAEVVLLKRKTRLIPISE